MAPTNGKIENLLISEIEVNLLWNTRFKDEQSSGGPGEDSGEEGCTFDQLVLSIEKEGQDTPIIVRPNPKSGKKPHSLVAGFRRLSALAKIAEKKGDKNPTVRAIVRDMTELQARELNVRENTARDDLSGADLAFGVGELVKAYKESGKKPTQQQVADMLGMSQAYIGKLMKITDFVQEPILKDWRASIKKATIDEMVRVASVPVGEQKAKYEEFTRGASNGAEPGDATAGKNSWVITAKRNAEAIGKILGTLVRDGAIVVDDEDTFFEECISVLVKINKKAKKAEINSVAKVCKKAYNAAYEAEVVEEGAEVEPKAKKGASQARAEN